MLVCEYCNNNFTSKMSLNNHQKRAKYCIDIQKLNNINVKQVIFECQWCEKQFNIKSNLSAHIECCKTRKENLINDEIKDLREIIERQKTKLEKYKNQIETQKIQIEEQKCKIIELTVRLEDKVEMSNEFKSLHSKREECIEKIALQPKNTTTKTTSNTQNNILNNLPIFNLTKEKLQLIASTEFTHELFLRGQEGAAKFATNIARKENDGDLPWVVSDKNRGIVKMKGEDGIIITDYDVEIITNLVFEAIKDKNQEYFDAAYPPYDTDAEELDPDEAERVEANKARADKCFSDIAKMKRNNKVFKKKLIEYSM